MKTLFLDRDGVINSLIEKDGEKVSPQRLEEFRFLPKVKEALELAKENGFQIIVFTNQPDVQKDWRELDREALEKMNDVLRENGVDKIYACTHGPYGGKRESFYRNNGDIVTCDCRKPQIGMIEKSQEALEIDFDNSWVIGDSETDIEAALRYEQQYGVQFAGRYKIGMDTQRGDLEFESLYKAIQHILK